MRNGCGPDQGRSVLRFGRRREATQGDFICCDNPPMLNVLAICIGACVGALARWRLGLWLSPGGLIPWGTLAANLVGGYLIGVCVAVFHALPQIDPVWRLALPKGPFSLHLILHCITLPKQVAAAFAPPLFPLQTDTKSLLWTPIPNSTNAAWPMPGRNCRTTQSTATPCTQTLIASRLPTRNSCSAARHAASAFSWKCSSPTWARPSKASRTPWWSTAAPGLWHPTRPQPSWPRPRPVATRGACSVPSRPCATPATTTSPASSPRWWRNTASTSAPQTASTSARAAAPASWRPPTGVPTKPVH